jgi:CBS domain containing-hemolysin-like protein
MRTLLLLLALALPTLPSMALAKPGPKATVVSEADRLRLQLYSATKRLESLLSEGIQLREQIAKLLEENAKLRREALEVSAVQNAKIIDESTTAILKGVGATDLSQINMLTGEIMPLKPPPAPTPAADKPLNNFLQ